MEASLERRRAVIAVVLAILAALGLAASASYALPPTSAKTVTQSSTVVLLSGSCLSEVSHTLILPGYRPPDYGINGHIPAYANVTLTDNGTITIAGMTYWYVSFIPVFTSFMNAAYVTFHNVTFYLNSVVQYELSGREVVGTVVNGTQVREQIKLDVAQATILTTRTNSDTPCSYALPSITVQWEGCCKAVSTWEYFNEATVNHFTQWLNKTTPIDQEGVAFPPYIVNPWFTQHTSPQAGVAYQTNGGQITLYVSTS